MAVQPIWSDVFAEDDPYAEVLEGYDKAQDIMSVTCDEASTVAGIAATMKVLPGGNKPFVYNTNSAAGALTVEDTENEEHGPAIKVVTLATEAGTLSEYIMGWYSYTDAGSGAVVYQGDFCFLDFIGSHRILEPVYASANMKDGTSFQNKVYAFVVESSGDAGVVMVGNKKKTIEAEKWYTFAVAINMDEGIAEYLIDNELICTQSFKEQYVEALFRSGVLLYGFCRAFGGFENRAWQIDKVCELLKAETADNL